MIMGVSGGFSRCEQWSYHKAPYRGKLFLEWCTFFFLDDERRFSCKAVMRIICAKYQSNYELYAEYLFAYENHYSLQ